MNRPFSLSALGLLALATTAAGQAQSLPDAMRGCMQHQDSLQRLSCFERLTQAIGVRQPEHTRNHAPKPEAAAVGSGNAPNAGHQTSPAPSPRVSSWHPQAAIGSGLMPGKTKVGEWEVTVSTNPVSGGNDVKLRLKSGEGRNQYAARIGLVVQCKNGRGSARLIWDEPLLRDIPIDIKLDDRSNAAATAGWQRNKNNEQWMLQGDVRPMLKALTEHGKMQINVRTYETEDLDDAGEGAINAVWDLSGAEYALRPFYTLCGA